MSLSDLILKRELFDKRSLQREMMATVIESHSYRCQSVHTFDSTITYMDIDSSENKFLLSGFNDGYFSINEITNANTGQINLLSNQKFVSTVNKCQWYPTDTGMFSLTSNDSVTLFDTNNLMQAIDCFKFSNCKLFWSDWNANSPSYIAAACSLSAVRIIDIRTGSFVQQITTNSNTNTSKHNVTRISWAPFDSDCLIAGDSSGLLHIYDIRRPKRSVRIIRSTSCEPITCLTFSKDKMSVLTCHGISSKLNLWHFVNCDLKNSNIKFECPEVKSKKNKQNDKNCHISCQIFVTNDFIFSPNEERPLGNDIIVHNISTGMRTQIIMPSEEQMFRIKGPNCVTGIDNGVLLLYSGGQQRLCAWTPNIQFEDNNRKLHRFYADQWSDSE